MKISVIIPVFDEAKTLEEVIKKVEVLNIEKEIIAVDDGSSDGSLDILRNFADENRIKLICHERNFGKGAAIKSGLKEATGDIVIVQDADLETNPNDYHNLIKPITDKETRVVFGHRTAKKPASVYWWGGKTVSLITRLLYGGNVKDVNNGYKVMTRDLWRDLDLKSDRFQICEEITAKLLKRKEKIIQIPTQYFPRTKKQGKKLRLKDGIISIMTLLKFRFFR
ncbi:MAG: glycosyltransferase family 2 protein [Candidatus Azambacteria bacterium]|nr:glycosyltransferase family 2 protein [Candidatus Azambacteria bacterium]